MLKKTDGVSFMYENVAFNEVADQTLDYVTLSDVTIERPLYFIYPKHALKSEKLNTFYHRFLDSIKDNNSVLN
jgi:hypothetical protein